MSLSKANDLVKAMQSSSKVQEAIKKYFDRDDIFEAPLKYEEVPSVDKDPIENYRHKRYILTGDVLNVIRALVNSKVHLTPQARLTEITLRMRLPLNGLPCEQFLEDMFSILEDRFPKSEISLEAKEYDDTP